jgi:hypothetical protein
MKFEIEILNPKAEGLLREMEILELISIKNKRDRAYFEEVLSKVSAVNESYPMREEEIQEEVDLERDARRKCKEKKDSN